MWSFFGGGSSSSSSKNSKELPKKAIIELREHISLLNKKQTHLQTQIDNQNLQIKQLLNKNNKNQAKIILKRRHLYEQQLNKLNDQIDSLEQQLFSIESANLNLETMNAMKQGSNAMKLIHKGLDIDKVDDTMDEIREQVDLSNEISDAISKPIFNNDMLIDEDELDNELDLLQQDTLHDNIIKETPNTAAVPVELPNIPTNKITQNAVQQEEEDDEDEKALRELQAEMGL